MNEEETPAAEKSQDWRENAREEWLQTGRWNRMVGGGFVTSSKDPEDWEHPYLK